MDSEGLAVVVLGAGAWGRNIVRDLLSLGVAVRVVDPSPEARVAAERLGAGATFGNLSELRDHLAREDHAELCPPRIAGVVVATPASQHESDVLEIAALDVPIACEKPLATTTESARRIVTAVGSRLTVLHVWRYHPALDALAGLIRAGRIGAVHSIRSTRTNWTSPRTDTDPVWTLLPHDLSIALHLLGHVPTLTGAHVDWRAGRAEAAWATYRGPRDEAFIAEVSARTPDKRREIRVQGEDAVALWSADAPDVVTIAGGTDLRPQIERVQLDGEPALRRELSVFADHLRGGPAPPTDAAEGLAIVEAVEATIDAGRPDTLRAR